MALLSARLQLSCICETATAAALPIHHCIACLLKMKSNASDVAKVLACHVNTLHGVAVCTSAAVLHL